MKVVSISPGVRLGMGMDALSEEPRATAVDFRGSADSKWDGQRVVASTKMVESQQQLMESMNISAAASIRYGFASVDAKMELSKEHAVNSSSLFLVMRATVRTPPSYMLDPIMKQDAGDLWGENQDEFRSIYGDHFVDEVYSGGEFFGLFVFETFDEASHSALQASLRAAATGLVLGAEIQVSVKSAISEFEKRSSMSIYAAMDGGAGLQNPTNMTQLETLYRDFNRQVGLHPVPYQVSLKDYRYLPPPAPPTPPDPLEILAKESILATCSSYVIDAISTRSEIDFVLRNPDQFDSHDSSALRAHRRELDRLIPKWAERATGCAQDISACALAKDEEPPPAINIPKRRLFSGTDQGVLAMETKWDWLLHHNDQAKKDFSATDLDNRNFRDHWQPGPEGRHIFFNRLGKPRGALTVHVDPDLPPLNSPDIVGYAQDVQAYSIYGSFLDWWLEHGGAFGNCGYPAGDENYVQGMAGWRNQRFVNRHPAEGIWKHESNPAAVYDWPPEEYFLDLGWVYVPDYTGRNFREIASLDETPFRFQAENAEPTYHDYRDGQILRMEPQPGTLWGPGTMITCFILYYDQNYHPM